MREDRFSSLLEHMPFSWSRRRNALFFLVLFLKGNAVVCNMNIQRSANSFVDKLNLLNGKIWICLSLTMILDKSLNFLHL